MKMVHTDKYFSEAAVVQTLPNQAHAIPSNELSRHVKRNNVIRGQVRQLMAIRQCRESYNKRTETAKNETQV